MNVSRIGKSSPTRKCRPTPRSGRRVPGEGGPRKTSGRRHAQQHQRPQVVPPPRTGWHPDPRSGTSGAASPGAKFLQIPGSHGQVGARHRRLGRVLLVRMRAPRGYASWPSTRSWDTTARTAFSSPTRR
jgi:hypothetical protein